MSSKITVPSPSVAKRKVRSIIRELESKGVKIWISHKRLPKNLPDVYLDQETMRDFLKSPKDLEEINNFGGETRVTIERGNSNQTQFAACCPQDNFCKSQGTYLALKRALRSLPSAK